MVRFKELEYGEFARRYEADDPSADIDDLPVPRRFGEVRIPGHGWHGCVLGHDGNPSHFWDDDDGWKIVPKVKFVKV